MSTTNALPDDLNLLRTLDLLLTERSVTRAARRLGVTQSAVSHKLKRLRAWFDDPLLVGGRRGLVLTERAEHIAGPLHRALIALGSAVQSAMPFDPATSSRKFVLGTSDYGEFEAGPHIAAKLTTDAPNLRLVIDPPGPDLVERLESGRIDLAIGPAFRPAFENPSLMRTTMLSEGFVLVLRKHHPVLSQPLTIESYLSLGHIQIAPTGRPGGVVDAVLARRDVERRVVFRTPHFVAAPFIAAGSDLALTAPLGLARQASQYVPLDIVPMPFDVPELEIYLLWHERQQHDPGHQWLRTLVIDLSRHTKQQYEPA